MIKSHFNLIKSYQPIYAGGQIIFTADTIITSLNETLLVTNRETGKILQKYKFDDRITFFNIINDNIYIGFNSGHILNKNPDEKYNIHKGPITHISFHSSFIVTGSVDKKVKIHNFNDMSLYGTIFCRNTVSSVVFKDYFVFAGDLEGNIYQYNIEKKKVFRFQVHSSAVTCLEYIDNNLYSCGRDGKFFKYCFDNSEEKITTADMFLDTKNGEEKSGKISYIQNSLEFSIESFIFFNDQFYLVGESNKIYIFSKDLKLMEERVIYDFYGQSFYKNIHYKCIVMNEKIFLITNEDEILSINENFKTDDVIIGNNDEITDMLEVHNHILISTNSGRLRYGHLDRYLEGEYCFRGYLLEGHLETIMCLGKKDDKIVSCSRDGTLMVWSIENDNINSEKKIINEDENATKKYKVEQPKLIFKKLKELHTHIESVNSCDLSNSILVSVGKDMTLQIFSTENEIKQLFTSIIHNKEINSVKICDKKKIIVTASHDKTSKIFDYEGNLISILSGHKRGIWSVDIGTKIIATCSTDETIRIWDIHTHSCIKVLEGHNCSVIKIKIFNNDKQIISCGNDNIIRIWDVKKGKCVAVLNNNNEKVWSIIFDQQTLFTGSADGIVNVYDDVTEKIVTEKNLREIKEKEVKFEIEKNRKDGNLLRALQLAYSTNDIKNIYQIVAEMVLKNDEIDKALNILVQDKSKFMNIIEKYVKIFKNSIVIQMMLSKGLSQGFFSGENKEIKTILIKHFSNADDLLIQLASYEPIFKELYLEKLD